MKRTFFLPVALLTMLCTAPTAGLARVSFGIAVGVPPPAPVAVGPVGVAPGPGYVWVDGYWDWIGGRWVWIPGRWALPPHPHAMWVGPVYRVDHGRVRYFRGHWI